MEPEIMRAEARSILGLERRITIAETDWDAVWSEYHPHHQALLPQSRDGACYGVYFGTGTPGVVDFVMGMAVAPGTALDGLVARDLPGGEVAVWRCDIRQLGTTWQTIYGSWLPTSGYTEDPARPCYEVFPPGSETGATPVSVVLPVAGVPDGAGVGEP